MHQAHVLQLMYAYNGLRLGKAHIFLNECQITMPGSTCLQGLVSKGLWEKGKTWAVGKRERERDKMSHVIYLMQSLTVNQHGEEVNEEGMKEGKGRVEGISNKVWQCVGRAHKCSGTLYLLYQLKCQLKFKLYLKSRRRLGVGGEKLEVLIWD